MELMHLKSGIAHIVLPFVVVVIIVLILLVLIAQGKIKNPAGPSQEEATVAPKTVYKNPFDKNNQYVNPFDQFKNPFYSLR